MKLAVKAFGNGRFCVLSECHGVTHCKAQVARVCMQRIICTLFTALYVRSGTCSL
jgi:hypothetical protein